MTVIGLGLLKVLQPFLKLTVATDLQRREILLRLPDPVAEAGVYREQRLGLQADAEECIDKHAIASGPHGLAAMLSRWRAKGVLRRVGWSGDEPAMLRMFHHVFKEELRRLFENWIDPLAKKL